MWYEWVGENSGVRMVRESICYSMKTTEQGDRNVGPNQEDCSGLFLRQFSTVNRSVTEVSDLEYLTTQSL
jgi:hypothetical protein